MKGKHTLIIFSFLIIVVSLLVSCSVNRESNLDMPSTTAVTDEQGTTHYYQPVTENEVTSAYVEIVTDKKGKAVTKKNGEYATKEHTTILTTKGNISTSSTNTNNGKIETNSTTSFKNDLDNNIVDFPTISTENVTTEKQTEKETTCISETTKPPEKEANNIIESTTKIATDNDGWINKWY